MKKEIEDLLDLGAEMDEATQKYVEGLSDIELLSRIKEIALTTDDRSSMLLAVIRDLLSFREDL